MYICIIIIHIKFSIDVNIFIVVVFTTINKIIIVIVMYMYTYVTTFWYFSSEIFDRTIFGKKYRIWFRFSKNLCQKIIYL